MAPSVFTYLEGHVPIPRHDHVAVFYRSRSTEILDDEEPRYRLVSFVAEGLRNGDLCQVIGPGAFELEVVRQLRGELGGLDRYLRNGTLRFHQGFADLRRLRDWSKQVFLDAENMRAPAVRWLEDSSWPEFLGFPMPGFFEFHATLNYQVKHYPSVALCQYAIDRTEARHLLSAITVHRHLVIEGNLVRDNPFYMPPEQYIPIPVEERERDLARLFYEVGFDLDKLLNSIIGYGRLSNARL